MKKMKWMIQRFMNGRYGLDQLNIVILILATFMIAFSQSSRMFMSYLLGLILVIIYFYRMMSKDVYQRGKENQWMLVKVKWVKNNCMLLKHITDKNYAYFVCSNCAQIVRVPKGRGKIEITCPKCRKKFDKKT